ncbi:hypothetical protein AcW1_006443 [Taiwanofungus camphoratus]|nr:hypothetical protein AcW1_006443 [Antrodia cinnamomea]
MDDIFLPPRRRQARPATAAGDGRGVPRSFDSFPSYNRDSRPTYRAELWRIDSELSSDTPGASSSSARTTASKIMNSVRRSFSTSRRRETGAIDSGMYSTAVESSPPIPSPYSFYDAPDTPPTIEQIAMGLHVSRTPHLRPVRAAPSPHMRSRPREDAGDGAGAPCLRRRRSSASATMLPPPPPRSSLKKPRTPTSPHSAPPSATLTPTASDLSLSGSTLTSNAPPTPRASMPFIPARLQLSMSRLLRVPSRKSNTSMSSPSMTNSDDDKDSAPLTPRKMVRFSSAAAVPVRDADASSTES